MKRNMVIFGSEFMSEECGICGEKPKRKFPHMNVHLGIDAKRVELIRVHKERDKFPRLALISQRILLCICISCAQRINDKLDRAIDEARERYQKSRSLMR